VLTQRVSAASNEHVFPDPSTMTAFTLGIRIGYLGVQSLFLLDFIWRDRSYALCNPRCKIPGSATI
jgi:hypothetical protein